MASFTLGQLFGSGASQSAFTVTIDKSGLIGLTPNSSNRAEQILAALIYQLVNECEGWVVDPTGDPLIDPSGEALSYSFRSDYETLEGFFWRTNYRDSARFTRIVIAFRFPPSNTPGNFDANLL